MSKRPLNAEEIEAAARILDALQETGFSQESVGAEVGVSQGMIWQWANGRLPVPARRAPMLAAALRIDDPGEISPDWRRTVGKVTKQEFVTIPASRGTPQSDDVMVRFFPHKHASAGYGAANGSDDGQEPLGLKFSSRSLSKKGIPPEKAFVIYARGDSMEPDISDGDAILFDTSRVGQIRDGRPYVIEVDGHESVKILHRRPGGIVLVQSRNSEYPSYEVSLEQDGFRILGEVMWTAGWV